MSTKAKPKKKEKKEIVEDVEDIEDESEEESECEEKVFDVEKHESFYSRFNNLCMHIFTNALSVEICRFLESRKGSKKEINLEEIFDNKVSMINSMRLYTNIAWDDFWTNKNPNILTLYVHSVLGVGLIKNPFSLFMLLKGSIFDIVDKLCMIKINKYTVEQKNEFIKKVQNLAFTVLEINKGLCIDEKDTIEDCDENNITYEKMPIVWK